MLSEQDEAFNILMDILGPETMAADPFINDCDPYEVQIVRDDETGQREVWLVISQVQLEKSQVYFIWRPQRKLFDVYTRS